MLGVSGVNGSGNNKYSNNEFKGSQNNKSNIENGLIRITHKVVLGDTLWSISQEYGMSLAKLKEINGINKQDDIIRRGQDLIVLKKTKEEASDRKVSDKPFFVTESETKSKIMHRVLKGETLWSISQNYRMTVDELRELNNISEEGTNINIGQMLDVSENSLSLKSNKVVQEVSKGEKKKTQESDTEKKVYIVQKGDTLWGISRKYRMTVDELKERNGLQNNIIHAGQALIVSVADAATVEVTSSPNPIKTVADFKAVQTADELFNRIDDEKVLEFINTKIDEVFSKEGWNKWNRDFLRHVVGISNPNEAECRSSIKHLQKLLGFSESERDGKMGTGTVMALRREWIYHDKEFQDKLSEMCEKYNKDGSNFFTKKAVSRIIFGESKFDLRSVNPDTGAAGLFQFTNRGLTIIKDCKYTTQGILKMTPLEQLEVYEKYLDAWGYKGDMHLSVLQAAPTNYKTGRENLYSNRSEAFRLNASWRNDYGAITVASVKKSYDDIKEEYLGSFAKG